MPERLRPYALATIVVLLTGFVRFLLIPVLGNRFGFDFFLISTFLCGRYLGFGPCAFALIGGAALVCASHFVGPALHDPFFVMGLVVYLVLGAIVALLCASEERIRRALHLEVLHGKAAEEAVRANEIRLRAILDHMPAAISFKDTAGRYALVNRGWEALFGVSNDRIVGLTNYDLISMTRSKQMSQDIADEFFDIDRKVLQTGELVEFEDVVPSDDDQRLFATVKFPIKDVGGMVTGIGGISLDITERRRAIDCLAAEQEILQRTIEVQDQEQRLVAYEIHDGLVQYATAALLQLEAVKDHCESPSVADKVEAVLAILRRTVAEGRRIISGIRATVLDDCGLVAAVQQLLEEEERAHVHVELVTDENLGRMAPKSEEALYRITQEALTNVYKHSQANRVRIELTRRGDLVHLEVRDWGIGFTPPTSAKGVHGLRGMSERARIVGGQCTIENARDGGTKVVVDLPYLDRQHLS